MSTAGLEMPWQCGVCKARFFRQNLLKLHNDNFHNDTLVVPANYEAPASQQPGLWGKMRTPKRNSTVKNCQILNETPHNTISTDKIVETIEKVNLFLNKSYKNDSKNYQNYLVEDLSLVNMKMAGSSDSVKPEDPNEGDMCVLVVDQDGGMFVVNEQHLQDDKNGRGKNAIHAADSTEETNGIYTKDTQSDGYRNFSKINLKATQRARIADSIAQDTSVSDHTDPVIRGIIAKISHFKGIKPKAPRETPEFPCKRCDKVFATKHERRLHVETHARDLRFVCSVCGRGFRKHVSLRTHCNVHVEGKHHQCPHCKRMYRSEIYLKKHMKMHDPSELKYQCQICEKKFPHKQWCDHHMRTHSAETPYNCRICGKRFRQRSSLESHVTSHDGRPRALACSVCGRRYRRRSTLAHHMRAHAAPTSERADTPTRTPPRLQAVVPPQ